MTAESTSPIVQARREFLQGAAGLALLGCVAQKTTPESRAPTAMKNEHEEAEVTPGEDLMQEHGVLERILLLYDEAARRIERAEPLDLAVITSAAGIVRRFVEDYHEKLEERFVFPRLESAGREIELVKVLLQQHQRGRQLTDEIVKRAGAGGSPELALALRNFGRMYRPHAAREDTVVFRAFRELVGRSAYHELGEQFEEQEHQLFGEHGFVEVVGDVADLEQALGIHDLASFTPP